MKILACVGLILIMAGFTSSAISLLADYPIIVNATKCQPHYNVSMTPTSSSVNPGSSASLVATVQSVCKLQGLSIQYFRSLTPQVTNGPVLPPNSCYGGCNIVGLPAGSSIQVETTITTSASTPAGTYTFTLTVNPDTCPYSTGCAGLDLSRTVSSTLTVT